MKFNMKKAAALLLAGSMVAGYAVPAAAEAEEKVVTAAMDQAWDTMMPLNTTSNYTRFICDQIYDRLTQTNADGSIEGRLAESWTVNDASDAVTFKLHEDAVWSDGEPVTAEDVVFSYQMYSDPSVEAKSRYHLEYIAGVDDSGAELSEDSIEVTADSDYEVTFKLKEAMYPDTFLQDIDTVFIIPKHVFEGKTAEEINAPDLWANPVGSGPFIYDSEINGERMEFTKNENYYLGTPNIDRLIIRVVPSANVLSGLMNGELDLIGFGSVLTDDWETAKSQDNLVTESVPTTSYTTLIFNTQKEYLTQEVRQALNMAINRDVLVNGLLMGEGTPIMTPIAPVSPYYNDKVQVQYDPEKAKELLAEAGYPDGFEVTFDAPNDRYMNDEQIAQAVAGYLEKVGIKVNLNLMPKANFFSYIKPLENKSMFLMTGWSDASGDGLSLMHDMLYYDREAGNGGVNRGHYSNAQVDALIDQAFTEMDDTKRGELVAEADKIAREDYAYIPLHFEQDTYAIKDTLNYTPRMNKYVYAWEFSYK